jgi:hypothetical protein
VIPALKSKGFNVYEAESEEEFLENVDRFDEAWFSSTHDATKDSKKFIDTMREFHEDGKGIMVWADNEPSYVQANEFLGAICGGVSKFKFFRITFY